MRKFRVYPLNEQGHVCDPPIIVEAATDDFALATARQLADGRDVEVWDESRCVGSIKFRPDGQASESHRRNGGIR